MGSSGWLTNSLARQGWSSPIKEMQFFPGISFAETITNSSHGMPGPKVIFLIRPRGIWLRTVAPKNMLGRTMSSTYCDLPVTLSRPYLRGTDLPTMGSAFICECSRLNTFDRVRGPPRAADGIVYDRLGADGVEDR